MKKFTFLLLVVPFFFNIANAQSRKSGIAVSLGAAANYYYGPGDRNFGEFDNNRLNWQANGMLGLTIARDQNDHRTMIAGFGSFGMNNASTLSNILNDQHYVTTALDQSSTNNFYQLEAGLLIGEVFRISTGVGQQVFNKQTMVNTSTTEIKTGVTSLKYNSTTVGFNFNVAAVAIVVNCNFEYGKDFTKTIVVPSAGLMLRF